MSTETDDPIEWLKERVIALETELADVRAYFAARGHIYAGAAPQGVSDGDNNSNAVPNGS